MGHLLTLFNGATIFTKIDLCDAYYLIRIQEGQEHLTCFRTRFGSFEYLVMPFGLTNAPASFQALVNEVFSDLLDSFVAIYLDNIMIYSKTLEEHQIHVRTVLERLHEENMYAKASKCEFHKPSVEYLGCIVSGHGLKMDKTKVQTILDWPEPSNLKALQSFLGFANFYWKFIFNYSKMTCHLSSLTKKDIKYEFGPEARKQFEALKLAFTTAPIL